MAALLMGEKADPKDGQIAELQRQAQFSKKQAAEERFLWVLAMVAILDFALLGSMQNWSAPLVVGVIELIGLVVWADRCEVKAVAPLVDRITGMIGKKAGGES